MYQTVFSCDWVGNVFHLNESCNVFSVVGDGGEPLIIENDMLRLVTEKLYLKKFGGRDQDVVGFCFFSSVQMIWYW